MYTHDEVGKASGVRDTAGKPVDRTAVSWMLVLDTFDRPRRQVRLSISHLQSLAVTVCEHWSEVAFVLDMSGEDGRPCTTRSAGLLLTLSNDKLVLHGVVNHVELVLVAHLAGLVRGRRHHQHDARRLARRRLGVVVHADRREVHVLLGHVRPLLHQVPRDLRRAFFEIRFTRVLDASGYARLKHWRIYAEEGLARREVTLWLGTDGLAVEFAGDTLARYEVDYRRAGGGLRQVHTPELFETVHRRSRPQPRLFELEDVLGANWLKALRLDGYATRRKPRPRNLQQQLFSPALSADG